MGGVSIICVLIAMLPMSAVLDESCDLVEVNSYYDNDGHLVFQQLIFWDWKPEESSYRCFAWMMIKCKKQYPVFDRSRNCWTVIFLDEGTLRRIRAPSVRYTWTQYDPEFLDREHLSPDKRRGLARSKR